MEHRPKKNLIYFIYWDAANGMLKLNLDTMSRFISQFDGKIIIKVAGVKDLSLATLNVYPWLKQAEIVKNDPLKNEMPHFISALTQIDFDDSITFYAHAKGVSREQPTRALKNWVYHSYVGNLATEPNLKTKLFSGCFGKLRQASTQVPVPWHYSGSFYWFKNKEVLNRYCNKDITQDVDTRWFTECFPGWLAKEDEVEFKLFASDVRKYNLYKDDFWLNNPTLSKLFL